MTGMFWPRGRGIQVLCGVGTALAGFLAVAHGEITVDAAQVVRKVPATFNGTNINAHVPNFATNAGGINFQADLEAAKVGIVRTLAYPDSRQKDHHLDYFDKNIRAILKCGATPLLLQYINPGLPYYNEDGQVGTAEKPGTPESNLVFLVRRYLAQPFNLQKQYWEVGNEPDIGIDWKMDADDYAKQFNRIHEALVKAGLRDHVVLCGPVSAFVYWTAEHYTYYTSRVTTSYVDTFLRECSQSVDLVDLHSYCTFGGPHEEMLGLTRSDKLDSRFVTDRPSTPATPYDGMAALLAKMEKIHFGRPDVGVALTEYGSMTQKKPLTGGLWNLATTQESLYNPRMRLMASYVFDGWGAAADTLTHYGKDKQKNDLYWALWIAGNLRGDTVLARDVSGHAMSDGRPYLIVAATRNDQFLFIEVINRDTRPIKDHITINGVTVGTDAKVFTMTSDQTPDQGQSSPLGSAFDYEFPPASATVIRLPLSK